MTTADPAALAAAFLEQDESARLDWIAAHRPLLTLAMVQKLKDDSDAVRTTDPVRAKEITSATLLLAHQLPELPQALALAHWARGNWEALHDPQRAIELYHAALTGYHPEQEALNAGRVYSNLVFVLADSGRLQEADHAYQAAFSLLTPLGQPALRYRLLLEQNYGWLLHSRGLFDLALAAYARALELVAHFNDQHAPVIELELRVNHAVTLGVRGQLLESRQALEAALPQAVALGQQLTVARITMNLGKVLAALGRPASALAHFQTARAQFAALDNQMEAGTVLLLEAALFERIGALRDACVSYERARAHFATRTMALQVGTALTQGAAAYRRYGHFARAAGWLDEAERLWRSLDQRYWQTVVQMEHVALALDHHDHSSALHMLAVQPPGNEPLVEARWALLRGDALLLAWRTSGDNSLRSAARAAFLRVLAYAQREGERVMQRRSLAALGQLALDTPEVARTYLDEAAALDDLLRQELSVEELKAGLVDQTSDVLPLLARLAVERGDPLQALVYAWRAKGSALLEVLLARQTADGQPSPQQQMIDQTRRELAARRWHLAQEIAGAKHPHAQQELRERADRTIRELEGHLHELRRAGNRALASDVAPLDEPQTLLARLDADVLVEYLRCGDELLALLAEPSGECRAVWLGPLDTLQPTLKRLELCIRNVIWNGQHAEARLRHRAVWLAECQALLQHCYERLVAPLGLQPDQQRVVIAPCAPLTMLPFAALWDGKHYLVERHEIEQMLSGALLAAPAPQTAPGPALFVGDTAGGVLRAAHAEAAALQAAFPDCICRIDQPSSIDLLMHQHGPELLHIFAHSVLRHEDAPMFSALQLTGELLSVEQCYDLPLRGTRLVTLNGCATASGAESGGALLAFQSALFAAGAQRVLSSLWPCGDETSSQWMARFYTHLAAGLPPATALRQTQLDLLADPAFDHPAIWAAFACSRR